MTLDDEVVLTVRQSAGTHALLAGLGLASAALLFVAGLRPLAASTLLVASVWGAFLAATRTRCTVTRRRIVVEGLLRDRVLDLVDVTRAHLERDALLHRMLVVEHAGGALRVRDLTDPGGVVAVVESLARQARAGPAPVEDESVLYVRPEPEVDEKLPAWGEHKHGARPFSGPLLQR